MTPTLTYVAWMAVITWLLLLVASLIRARILSAGGLQVATGNREGLPKPTGLAGRAERTARNTLENFVLFAAIALCAHAAGLSSPRIESGATLFFWSRIVYVPVYYLGVEYLRTGVWLVSIAGLGVMLSAML